MAITIAWREIPWVLPVRAVQEIFAIIILGLTAYVIAYFDSWDFEFSSNTLNFMLFTSVWTLLVATPYLALSPLYAPQIAHRFVVIGVEAVTMIFWFAAFVALAALLPPPRACHSSACRSAQASTVIGAFEWVSFAVTAGFAIVNVFRNYDSSNKETGPEAQEEPQMAEAQLEPHAM